MTTYTGRLKQKFLLKTSSYVPLQDEIVHIVSAEGIGQGTVKGDGLTTVAALGLISIPASVVGLANVNNTSDANKPVSNATVIALSNKANLINGKLSATELPPEATSQTSILVNGKVGPTYLEDFVLDASNFSGLGTSVSPVKVKINELVKAYLEGLPGFTTGKILSSALNWITPSSGAVNIQPPPPTALVVDDTANTATWTLATGYLAADHEYSSNYTAATPTWTTAAANSVNVGNVAIASGSFAVRVRAISGRDISAPLVSGSPFTVSGVTYALEQTIIINFTNSFALDTAAGVNQFAPINPQESTVNNGYSKLNLIDSASAATPVDVAIGQAFGGASGSLATAGVGPHLYNDAMINSALSSVDSAVDSTIIISALDDTKFYHFYLLASSNSAGAGVQWTIGSNVRTKVTSDNYPLTANGNKYVNPAIERIFNIQPTGGVITIAARKSGTAYEQPVLTVMEIERSNVAKA